MVWRRSEDHPRPATRATGCSVHCAAPTSASRPAPLVVGPLHWRRPAGPHQWHSGRRGCEQRPRPGNRCHRPKCREAPHRVEWSLGGWATHWKKYVTEIEWIIPGVITYRWEYEILQTSKQCRIIQFTNLIPTARHLQKCSGIMIDSAAQREKQLHVFGYMKVFQENLGLLFFHLNAIQSSFLNYSNDWFHLRQDFDSHLQHLLRD